MTSDLLRLVRAHPGMTAEWYATKGYLDTSHVRGRLNSLETRGLIERVRFPKEGGMIEIRWYAKEEIDE